MVGLLAFFCDAKNQIGDPSTVEQLGRDFPITSATLFDTE
jgi:hypothetical protein